MPDDTDQFNAPAPEPPAPPPNGMVGSMPPPPPPPMMPVMFPNMTPKKGVISRIKDAVILVVFFGSLLLNFFLLIALGAQQIQPGLREVLITDGAENQRIAVINVQEMITDELADKLSHQFKSVIENDKYKALVLYVNTPGGAVTPSDVIANYVEKVKQVDKPVVVFMGSVAASGGYYISAGADYIMAGPTTITGSIGVIAQLPNIHGTLERIGAQVVVMPSTPATKKSIGSPFLPWDPANRGYIQKLIDSAHDRFVQVAYEGRQAHIPKLSQMRKLANGAALTSAQAKEAKLIDEDDAYFDQAIAKAAELAKLDDPKVVRLTQPAGLRELLASQSQVKGALINIDASVLDELTSPRLMYLWQGQ